MLTGCRTVGLIQIVLRDCAIVSANCAESDCCFMFSVFFLLNKLLK